MSARLAGVAIRHGEAAKLIFYSLFSQQYGGKSSAGIVSQGDSELLLKADRGLVIHIFSPEDIEKLKGDIAIGQNSSSFEISQPRIIKSHWGEIAICADTDEDTFKQFTRALRKRKGAFDLALDKIARELFGPYAFLILCLGRIYALRGDGRKPLFFGRINDVGYAVASQENAIRAIGGSQIRAIEPGEQIVFDTKSYQSKLLFSVRRCMHEIIFTQPPDSYWGGRSIYGIRYKIGAALAGIFHKVGYSADFIYPIPLGGNPYAEGMAARLNVKYDRGIIKNMYPRLGSMPLSKFINLANPDAICGKSIILVNDSLQSGEETRYITHLCREAQAREIHVATASLSLSYGQYGCEQPLGLMGLNKSFDEIAQELNATSFITLKPWQILRSMGVPKNVFCMECLCESKAPTA